MTQRYPTPVEVRIAAPLERCPIRWEVLDPILRRLKRGEIRGLAAATGVAETRLRKRMVELGVRIGSSSPGLEAMKREVRPECCCICEGPLPVAKGRGRFTCGPECKRVYAAVYHVDWKHNRAEREANEAGR